MLHAKLTKSTTFHPQTDFQREVINRMIVHTLWMYNWKHTHTWDESLPYVQRSYNPALHNTTSHSCFLVGLGLQPLYAIDVAMPTVTTREDSTHIRSKANKEKNFIEEIQHICQ